MLIDTNERIFPNKYDVSGPKSNTIVIDIGSFEIKAGYLGNPSIVIKNRLYKCKDKVSFEPFPSASVKSMLDSDVIVNFDVLEYCLDGILELLMPEELDNLILTITPCSPTENVLLDFLFENYKFKRIQLGYDFIYAYHKYLKEDCVIINASHSSIIVSVVSGNKIADIYKIDFGGKALMEYINYMMVDKYKEHRKDYRGLINHVRVSDNYNKEALSIYNEMCNGDYNRNIFLSEQKTLVIEKDNIKKKTVKKELSSSVPVVDYSLLNTEDNLLDSDLLKEKRRSKMIYCATLARFKLRIEKSLIELSNSIDGFEDELEKIKNLKKYIIKKKEKFQKMKRELELREKLRRDTKNKKTREFLVKHKEGHLTDDEIYLKNMILEAEDDKLEDALINEINELAKYLVELDPDFITFYANAVEVLRGDNIGRQCVNVELIKWPEIFFSPSIIGSEDIGLSEIFENVFSSYNIDNVLLCGGLSCINNFEKRIENEIEQYKADGHINLIKVADYRFDPFLGATFSNFFPIHSREDWNDNNK